MKECEGEVGSDRDDTAPHLKMKMKGFIKLRFVSAKMKLHFKLIPPEASILPILCQNKLSRKFGQN